MLRDVDEGDLRPRVGTDVDPRAVAPHQRLLDDGVAMEHVIDVRHGFGRGSVTRIGHPTHERPVDFLDFLTPPPDGREGQSEGNLAGVFRLWGDHQEDAE